MTLLFSSTFHSFLLPALPPAFISPSQDYVASTALRTATQLSDIQLTKHYYKPHVEDIKRQLETAKDLGSGSAEEWLKGLASLGKVRSSDAARWEQWEAKGGLEKVNSRPNPKAVSSAKQITPTDLGAIKIHKQFPDNSSLSVMTIDTSLPPPYPGT